jgi:hypothetical protein
VEDAAQHRRELENTFPGGDRRPRSTGEGEAAGEARGGEIVSVAPKQLVSGETVFVVVDRCAMLVVEDRGDRVLVSSQKAIAPGATLIERAQWQVPRADLSTVPIE